jgi:uncharacterized protein
MMDIAWLKQQDCIVFEAIVGSRAYNLANEQSDTDIRGIYIIPQDMLMGFEYPTQINNETNDIVYYEMGKYLQLLCNNNPNMLELLNIPDECILFKHDIMQHIKPELFLSKLCESSFANYAFTQIKKAYGLEKKIMQSFEETRKKVLDFCYVYINDKAVALQEYLLANQMQQEHCGLANINHLRDCYNLYYNTNENYNGIVKHENVNDVNLSSIAKSDSAIALLYFNKDGYSVYCKQYKEYWDWVAKRNDNRYNNTLQHGKKYDSKNMLHVFRLLHMAKEIAAEGKIYVRRNNDKAFLLDIKAGKYEYEDLVTQAEEIRNTLPELFTKSSLIDKPDITSINDLLVTIRKEFYKNK